MGKKKMPEKEKLKLLSDLYVDEEKLLITSKEWITFMESYNRFRKDAFKACLPFDPRFNAVHWGFAVTSLCREIAFGYCSMKAYAKHYIMTDSASRPSSIDFHVSYYADKHNHSNRLMP